MSTARPFEITTYDEHSIALVAGGGGFLGSALCQLLLQKNLQVICVDHFRNKNYANISGFEKNKNFRLIEHDLNCPLPKINLPHYIFHLAGIDEYFYNKELTLETLKVNSLGTQNLLELARQSGAKFTFASSCEVFSPFPLISKLSEGLLEQQKSFSHYEAKRFSESLIAQYVRDYDLNCRIVRLIDVYGPGMNLEAETTIAKIIQSAKEGNPFVLEEDGLEVLYPTYVMDAIEGLVRATFLSNTSGKIYSLLGEKITTSRFIGIITKLTENKTEIQFRKTSKDEPSLLLPPDAKKTQAALGWQPKTSLKDGLKKTLGLVDDQTEDVMIEEIKQNPAMPEEEIPPDEVLVEREVRGISRFNPIKLILAVFLIIFALTFPFLSIYWDILWGQKDLESITKIEIFSPAYAQIKARNAQNHFLEAQGKIEEIGWVFTLLNQEKISHKIIEDLQVVDKIAGGIEDIAQSAQVLEKLGNNIIEGGEIRDEELKNGKDLLNSALERWQEAEARLQVDPSNKEKPWVKRLIYYHQMARIGQKWLDILPQFIALNSRKTYLILLQNNMEIRPSGGFIGSYGLLTFENGKLADLKIEDVYTADGQLRGHVEPPAAIKKYLGKEHWFLRDSNWDPNFPQSAQITQWFLEKELNIKTDGVIALDLNLTKDLLDVFGPLELLDYKEKVSSQDLFEKTQKYTEQDFFPGSTQKKDFLGALSKNLVEKIKSNQEKWFGLGNAFGKAINEKHLSFYFNNSDIEQKILVNGWGGQIKNVPCQDSVDCFGDYLMVVDANLGVNKVNYWVKKNISDQVAIKADGLVSHELKINFQNNSSKDAWLGGVYKNYLRIYTPPLAVLDSLKIDNVSTSSAETATSSANITKNSGKTVWSLYLEIPSGRQREVTVSYHLSQKFPDKDGTIYEYLLQKQAGSQADPLSMEIMFPYSRRPKEVDFSTSTQKNEESSSASAGGLTQPGPVRYNGNLSSDRELKLRF